MYKFRPSQFLIYIVNFIFALASISLLVRFVLRLLGANPEAPIVSFIYTSTNALLNPFRGIFDQYPVTNAGVIEFSTLIAIGAYLLLAWLIIEFIELVEYSTTREV